MNKVHRTTPSHYYSVFVDYPGQSVLRWFGYSEKEASWQFYRAVRSAAFHPMATGVDLRQDSKTVASVPIEAPVPALA